jgi:hypothetical protein
MSVTATQDAAAWGARGMLPARERLALFDLLLRLGGEDPTDALAVAMLIAQLREILDTFAPPPWARSSTLEIEALAAAAEAADAVDRPALVRLLRVAVSELITGGELAAA